jgi:hypothetical protein
MSLSIPVRTWTQATHDARRFGEIRQIVLAYLHPDSDICRDEAFDRIVRVVDTADPPTDFAGTAVVGTWGR